MSVNKDTLDLLVKSEGCVLKAYQDTGGIWTIGVGHTSDVNQKVYKGLVITKDRAMELLQIDLHEAETLVDKLITVPLNENQRGALVSFTFNLGGGAFEGSTLRKKLNAGDYASVPSELNKWVHDNGKILTGLIRRRKAEGELFMKPVVSTVPVEKPIVGAPVGETETVEIPDNPDVVTTKTSTGSFLWNLLLMILKGK